MNKDLKMFWAKLVQFITGPEGKNKKIVNNLHNGFSANEKLSPEYIPILLIRGIKELLDINLSGQRRFLGADLFFMDGCLCDISGIPVYLHSDKSLSYTRDFLLIRNVMLDGFSGYISIIVQGNNVKLTFYKGTLVSIKV